ncbi:glycoprotein [Peach virus 1]|uniref:Glycoprotein n=1 Tax=Peach virus 1 TaxID=2721273 RepID=A0A6G9L6B0_9RHAB|nr:glycoprotein [Peach virus 1]QIQ60849.1 glycoprotein [Peach virus 1]
MMNIYIVYIVSIMFGSQVISAAKYIYPSRAKGPLHTGQVPPGVDFYPIYFCPVSTDGYSRDAWYNACLGSCSMDKQSSTASISVYYRNDTVGIATVWKILSTYVKKTTHENFLGYCSTMLQGDYSKTLAKEQAVSVFVKLKEDLIQNDRVTYDEVPQPDCKYFDDVTTEGFTHFIVKEQRDVKVDIHGLYFIQDPSTGRNVPYTEGAVQSGREWYVWDTHTSYPKSCNLELAGTSACTKKKSDMYYCHDMGVSFSVINQDTVTGTCVGDINISTDGVLYQLSDEIRLTSISDRLEKLWELSPEAVTSGLIASVNDALNSIERTYCTSLCDIVEVISHHHSDSTHVLETPIGPWMPIWKEGELLMTPCKADIDYYITSPMEGCLNNNVIKVESASTGDNYWWDPSLSYIDDNKSCSRGVTQDIFLRAQMSKKQPILFSFWRGDIILDYPYNTSFRWAKKMVASVRSSKWFPQLTEFSLVKPVSLPDVEKGFREMVLREYNRLGNFSEKSQNVFDEDREFFINSARSLWSGAKVVVNECVTYFESLYNWVKMMVAIAATLIIAVLFQKVFRLAIPKEASTKKRPDIYYELTTL